MKTLLRSLTFLALFAVISLPALVRAQNGPDSQGPPPGQDQGPDQGQGQGPDQGQPDASFQTFYDQLGDQGSWIQTDNYGYVFQPNVSDPDWAPYSDGHWVYTDGGWTWASNESFGWATYHYGRWANIDGTGWVWVPGYTWAPAWVSWRYGGGYCGWAPLPPETLYGAEYGEPGFAIGLGFHFGGDVDIGFNIGPGCYNFLRVEDMGERNYHGRYANRGRNFALVNQTTNITNVNVNRGGRNNFNAVVVNGPPLNEVNAHAREHVVRANLVASNQPGRNTLQGNSFAVFAPRVNSASVHQGRPANVGQTLTAPHFNRGESVTRPLAVNRTLAPQAPSADVVKAAEEAQAHAPARAKIATANTPVRSRTSTPFTALEPVAQHQASPQNSVVAPNNQKAVTGGEQHHHTPNAAATGESPAVSHPSTQVIQSQNQGGEGEQHHHTQSAEAAATGESPAVSHSSSPVFQPQNQGNGGGNTYHSQSQGNGGGDHSVSHSAPAPQAPRPAAPAAAAPHSAPAPSNNGGGQQSNGQSGGDKKDH
jgi:hypothetical protein